MDAGENYPRRSGRRRAVAGGLNQHPELKERVVAIMRLASGEEASTRTADEIETLLIEETRQLGQQAMGKWAQEQAGHVAREVRQQHPQSYRSKKTLKNA